MDEAASSDMTVRFTFDADKGLSRIQKVTKSLDELYKRTDRAVNFIDKTIGFFWRLIKTTIYFHWFKYC